MLVTLKVHLIGNPISDSGSQNLFWSLFFSNQHQKQKPKNTNTHKKKTRFPYTSRSSRHCRGVIITHYHIRTIFPLPPSDLCSCRPFNPASYLLFNLLLCFCGCLLLGKVFNLYCLLRIVLLLSFWSWVSLGTLQKKKTSAEVHLFLLFTWTTAASMDLKFSVRYKQLFQRITHTRNIFKLHVPNIFFTVIAFQDAYNKMGTNCSQKFYNAYIKVCPFLYNRQEWSTRSLSHKIFENTQNTSSFYDCLNIIVNFASWGTNYSKDGGSQIVHQCFTSPIFQWIDFKFYCLSSPWNLL